MFNSSATLKAFTSIAIVSRILNEVLVVVNEPPFTARLDSNLRSFVILALPLTTKFLSNSDKIVLIPILPPAFEAVPMVVEATLISLYCL